MCTSVSWWLTATSAVDPPSNRVHAQLLLLWFSFSQQRFNDVDRAADYRELLHGQQQGPSEAEGCTSWIETGELDCSGKLIVVVVVSPVT